MATRFLWSLSTDFGSSGALSSAGALSVLQATGASIGSSAIWFNSTTTFTSSGFNQGIWAKLFLVTGTSAAAATAGANVAGWFRQTFNSTAATPTLELTSIAAARQPDFIIPISTAAAFVIPTTFESAGLVLLPALDFQVTAQNNAGVSLTINSCLYIAPIAMQY